MMKEKKKQFKFYSKFSHNNSHSDLHFRPKHLDVKSSPIFFF